MHEKLNLIIYLNVYNNGRDKNFDKCAFELKLVLGSVLVLILILILILVLVLVLKALNIPYVLTSHF